MSETFGSPFEDEAVFEAQDGVDGAFGSVRHDDIGPIIEMFFVDVDDLVCLGSISITNDEEMTSVPRKDTIVMILLAFLENLEGFGAGDFCWIVVDLVERKEVEFISFVGIDADGEILTIAGDVGTDGVELIRFVEKENVVLGIGFSETMKPNFICALGIISSRVDDGVGVGKPNNIAIRVSNHFLFDVLVSVTLGFFFGERRKVGAFLEVDVVAFVANEIERVGEDGVMLGIDTESMNVALGATFSEYIDIEESFLIFLLGNIRSDGSTNVDLV